MSRKSILMFVAAAAIGIASVATVTTDAMAFRGGGVRAGGVRAGGVRAGGVSRGGGVAWRGGGYRGGAVAWRGGAYGGGYWRPGVAAGAAAVGAAAVGAAAASNYYGQPACGYYPYPPCY